MLDNWGPEPRPSAAPSKLPTLTLPPIWTCKGILAGRFETGLILVLTFMCL